MVVLNEFDARGGRLSSRSGATLLLTGTTLHIHRAFIMNTPSKQAAHRAFTQAFIKFTSTRAFTEKLLFKARLYTGGAGSVVLTFTRDTRAHTGTYRCGRSMGRRRGRHSLLFLHRPLLTEMPHSAVFLFG